jgi:hypothetical protein
VVADQPEHVVALCLTSNLRVFHRDKADYGGHNIRAGRVVGTDAHLHTEVLLNFLIREGSMHSVR